MSVSRSISSARRVALVAALAASALTGCGEPASDAPTTDQPRGERFNVVLISMDTTRADHLGCYGHPESPTPNIDRLAAGGVLFEQAVSPVPTTLASHSSVMTGTDPFVHGVRYNGSFHLSDANLTLAELLSEESYVTGATLGSYVLNREFGLDQGFAQYHDLRQGRLEASAEEVVTDAIDWLREIGTDQPFFLFAHLFDPHDPYEAPDPFAGRYSSPYLDEIAYTDDQIGRLLDELDTLGVADRTLVVLIGDHGESLGEHGEDTHSIFIYDSTIRVPLIMRAPGRIPAGLKVASQARLIDVAPTVAAFVGAAALPAAQGVSLLGDMDTSVEGPRRVAYGETLFPQIAFGYSALRSLRVDGWKYVHAPKAELYDLEADPTESTNLAAAEGKRVERMRETLRRWIEDAPVVGDADDAQMEMSEEQLERLKSLGYVGGSSDFAAAADELARFDPVGADPKDRIELMTLSKRALTLKQEGQLGEAEQLLLRIFEIASQENEELRAAHELMAAILVATDRYEESIEHYEATLKSGQIGGRTPTNLGAALIVVGQIDKALKVLELALQGEVVFAETHVNYGAALLKRDRNAEAIVHFREALKIDPTLAGAQASLASALATGGKIDEAIASYQSAISLDPEAALARRRLAELFIQQRRPQEALTQYQELVRLTPDDARVHQGLGMIYLQAQRAEDAARSLQRSVELDPTSARAQYTLSAAQAAQGRMDEAIASATRAAELAEQNGDQAFAGRIRKRIEDYRDRFQICPHASYLASS